MKKLFCLVSIPLSMLGCLNASGQSSTSASAPPGMETISLPFMVTETETPEAREENAIIKKSCSLLKSKDYDQLDELAAKFRTSKESFSDGNWKILSVYYGFTNSLTDDASWIARQKEIKEWIKAKPSSITARVALARVLVRYAWQARGHGYADTVSDEGMRLYVERMKQAAVVLSEAKKLNQQCPVYWSTLMGIAMALEVTKPQYQNIFNDAVKAYPDFLSIYRERADYLLPRWFGAEGEWEADLGQSADKIGGEAGDILYAQVVWSNHGFSSPHNNIFKDNKGLSWARIDRGLDAIEKKNPDSFHISNIHAHLAALAHDKQKARTCFLKTGGKMDPTAWAVKEEFISCAGWVFRE